MMHLLASTDNPKTKNTSAEASIGAEMPRHGGSADEAPSSQSSPVTAMDASYSPRGPEASDADEEAQLELDEQQPFISRGQNHIPGPVPGRRLREQLGNGARVRPHSWPYWKLAIFFLIVILSVLVLSVVPVSLEPLSRPPAAASASPPPPPAEPPVSAPDGHDNDATTSPPETDHKDETENGTKPPADDANHGSPVPAVVQYNDELPTAPQLRDVSQYVLDLSWDINAAPTTREHHWTIVDGRLNPDGIYRPMILINNQFPGPLVECNEGDTIVVHVENKAVNATSIHFHGLFQNGTNNMDGAVGITQCPIAPNSTFTYTFKIQHQSGTYWYHAHHSAQASDGLVGPVVVHSRDERTLLQKLEYASDRVIMVQDHYHNLTSELLMAYLRPDMENNEPVPDNALINGRGMRECKDFAGWDCDTANVSTPVFDLAAGQRHRLRFVNVGAFAEFQIQFDEHPFYVTEVDGTDVFPEPFHRLNILPAQRYSIILETNVTTTDSFWMRARMVTHCFTTRNPRLVPELMGVLRYAAPDSEPKPLGKEPTSKEWPEAVEVICRDLNTSSLHPIVAMNPPPPDRYISLDASFMIRDWRLARGYFNGSTWHHNVTSPSLHRFLDAPADATTLSGGPVAVNRQAYKYETELVLQTEGIRTIDFPINNFDDGSHPFHLHGHKFFVMIEGKHGYPPPAEDWPAYVKENRLDENPLRRDTVTIEGYGWAVIRVVLDNPGMWAFHCHNMWHAESGMLMQLMVRSDVVRTWKVGEQERARCALDGVATGMRPDDSIWFGDFGKS